MVCRVEPKLEDVSVDTEQSVILKWDDPDLDDLDTGFSFTYKPDPTIQDIHPNITIPRYNIYILFHMTYNSLYTAV